MESLYCYNWKRYCVPGTTDCSNLEEAICIAASDLENGEAWPVSIVHDDQILWSYSGSIGIGESLAAFANANNVSCPQYSQSYSLITMTDPLEPNDLSHLSDEEFRALCPTGEHAPGPEPLSPAAQHVLDAFENASDGEYVEGVWVVNERTMLAAALRAASDRVEHHWDGMECVDHLQAIAAELEGINS